MGMNISAFQTWKNQRRNSFRLGAQSLKQDVPKPAAGDNASATQNTIPSFSIAPGRDQKALTGDLPAHRHRQCPSGTSSRTSESELGRGQGHRIDLRHKPHGPLPT